MDKYKVSPQHQITWLVQAIVEEKQAKPVKVSTKEVSTAINKQLVWDARLWLTSKDSETSNCKKIKRRTNRPSLGAQHSTLVAATEKGESQSPRN